MPGKRKPKAPEGQVLPEFARIPLARIIEPQLPARVQMSEEKMTELIESIRRLGCLDPISVERHEGMFEIITGHRRFLASRSLKLVDIPAMIYAEGTAESDAMMLHENICREDLNPAEEALFMAQVREKRGLDEEGLCKAFGKSPDYIAGRFALLRGDPEIFAALQRGELRLGVAHELNRLTDENMRRYYLDLARRSDPSARVVHQWVQDWFVQQRPPLPIPPGVPAGVEESPPNGAQLPGGDGAPGATGPADGGAPAPFFGCELCGGTKDPYNLVTVQMHKWHWQDILAQVAKAASGQ